MTKNNPKGRLEFNLVSSTRSRLVKVSELTEDQLAGKILLGTAYGKDVFHCAYLAQKHCPNFVNRVRGYHLPKEVDEQLIELRRKQQGSIRVDFYAEK